MDVVRPFMSICSSSQAAKYPVSSAYMQRQANILHKVHSQQSHRSHPQEDGKCVVCLCTCCCFCTVFPPLLIHCITVIYSLIWADAFEGKRKLIFLNESDLFVYNNTKRVPHIHMYNINILHQAKTNVDERCE